MLIDDNQSQHYFDIHQKIKAMVNHCYCYKCTLKQQLQNSVSKIIKNDGLNRYHLNLLSRVKSLEQSLRLDNEASYLVFRMISKEAGQLMDKLKRLKTPENKEKLRIKNMSQEMIEYESKVKKWIVKFQVQMNDLDHQIKTLRQQEKKQQERTIQQIDNYELSLRNLLTNYSKQATKANQKLQSMVASIKEEMKSSLKHNIQKEKQSIAKYKSISQKVDKLIEVVRCKQKKSIDDYERVKTLIRNRANEIAEANETSLQQVIGQTRRLLGALDELQARIDQQIIKFIKNYDAKVYETNKIINSMIQYAAQN